MTPVPPLIGSVLTGTGLTVEYNWLKNAPQTVIAVKGGTLIDEFNRRLYGQPVYCF